MSIKKKYKLGVVLINIWYKIFIYINGLLKIKLLISEI